MKKNEFFNYEIFYNDAYERLLIAKQKDDAELVFSRNGKIVKVKARDLLKDKQ